MADNSLHIFKAHNPGCNCCPEEDEPSGNCTTLFLVECFHFVSNFGDGGSGNWRIYGDSTSGYTSGSSILFGPTGIYSLNIQIWPYVAGQVFAYWAGGGGTWTVEGVSEDYNGSAINGPVTYDPGSVGSHASTFTKTASASTPCGCSSFWGPNYPSFTSGQLEYYCSAFGACRPEWMSGSAARVRFSKPLWARIASDDPSSLEEAPLDTKYVSPIDGMVHLSGLYDPEMYWPWEDCTP